MKHLRPKAVPGVIYFLKENSYKSVYKDPEAGWVYVVQNEEDSYPSYTYKVHKFRHAHPAMIVDIAIVKEKMQRKKMGYYHDPDKSFILLIEDKLVAASASNIINHLVDV